VDVFYNMVKKDLR